MQHTDITQLKPQLLWKHFDAICSIPHPSHHTEALEKHIINFGKSLGLETLSDKTGNILIKKPASKGFENAPIVALQAHIDMVPQKNRETQHNFQTDPIRTIVENDWLTADNTTLGADNGIGAASMLAVLEDNTLQHGQIEALFTVEEEVGMTGAFGLEKGFLNADILLNTDTEDDDEIIIGCAGGIDANIFFNFSPAPVPENSLAFTVSVTGLKGGHSGIDIHLNRGNANLILLELLSIATTYFEVRIANIDAGNMRNAIPREAFATITIPKEKKDAFEKLLEQFKLLSQQKYTTEHSIEFILSQTTIPDFIIPAETTSSFLKATLRCPNGVIAMEKEIENVVETSNNVSIIKSTKDTIEINCLVRSSDDTQKENTCKLMRELFSLYGATISFEGSYPGWKPNEKSEVLKTLSACYEQVFSRKADIKVVHAGLECGIIGSTYPTLDMVSFGPTIKHPHSPDEKVHIPSVAKYWELLTETLKALK